MQINYLLEELSKLKGDSILNDEIIKSIKNKNIKYDKGTRKFSYNHGHPNYFIDEKAMIKEMQEFKKGK